MQHAAAHDLVQLIHIGCKHTRAGKKCIVIVCYCDMTYYRLITVAVEGTVFITADHQNLETSLWLHLGAITFLQNEVRRTVHCPFDK